MIENVKFSTIITTHRGRYDAAAKTLRAWLSQPADQIWLLDGSGEFSAFKTIPNDPRLSVFRMPVDLGTKMDYAFSLLTEGDMICLADDDMVPKAGLLEELYSGWKRVGGGIVGLIGRTFQGPTYRGQTTFFSAKEITEPVRVGFAGVAFLTTRDLFGFDVRGLPRNCDDIWMQMRKHPDVPKWVIPTKAFENLKEAGDMTAMYRNPELKAQRQEFYQAEYEEKYQPTGRTF